MAGVRFWLLGGAVAVALAAPASAAVSESDVLIAARALSFMEQPPSGRLRAAIVYAPGDPASVAEAERLQKILGSGLRVGDLELIPVMVSAETVAGADVGLFLLTGDLGAAARAVARATEAKHVPCITFDLAQVRSGACMMGVRSRPRVEILVNRAAAARSGIAFSAAFRMLITEF